jgi:hypothetical protein
VTWLAKTHGKPTALGLRKLGNKGQADIFFALVWDVSAVHCGVGAGAVTFTGTTTERLTTVFGVDTNQRVVAIGVAFAACAIKTVVGIANAGERIAIEVLCGVSKLSAVIG